MPTPIPEVHSPSDGRLWSRSTLLLFKMLGMQIVLARRRRHWTEDEVAKRARVSRTTVSKIEHGTGNVALGAVLEVCWVLGVPILGVTDLKGAEAILRETELQLATLPMRVRSRRGVVPSDAF
jgi:transcriptional regulator with XRE-family HTH domain